MSEPIPEAIPTSQDPRSKRPTKKLALTPTTQQASQLNALFAKPDKEIIIPNSSTPHQRGLAPPPEIVANVQGSSAGAGSGEFHVYKASRRREYERLKMMDEEVKREKENEEFEKQREEKKRKDEEKTRKNREKREKMKKKKGGKGKEKTEGEEPVDTRPSVEDARGVLNDAHENGGLPEANVIEEEGLIFQEDD
jgi:hypothetical protein